MVASIPKEALLLWLFQNVLEHTMLSQDAKVKLVEKMKQLDTLEAVRLMDSFFGICKDFSQTASIKLIESAEKILQDLEIEYENPGEKIRLAIKKAKEMTGN
jgi:hypothetical protein